MPPEYGASMFDFIAEIASAIVSNVADWTTRGTIVIA
jgi:hypothetical protein